jgi:cytochrome c
MIRTLAACVLATMCGACGHPQSPVPTGGNAERGRQLLADYGCGACHTIPGVRRAVGLVGPRLAGLSRRTYVAGVVQNTPDNLVAWIMQPQALSPRTAMPAVGVNEAEARDIAAYLYSQ